AFSVNTTRNIFHCFACGASGNVLDFVCQRENLEPREAALALQERFLSDQPESDKQKRPRQRAKEREAAESAEAPGALAEGGNAYASCARGSKGGMPIAPSCENGPSSAFRVFARPFPHLTPWNRASVQPRAFTGPCGGASPSRPCPPCVRHRPPTVFATRRRCRYCTK
ncbi:MAG: CHC2 zinc finger domain-containing protein, partial [Armatimonadota bacterium]